MYERKSNGFLRTWSILIGNFPIIGLFAGMFLMRSFSRPEKREWDDHSWHKKPPVVAWNWSRWRWGDPNSAPEKWNSTGTAVIRCVGLPPITYLPYLWVQILQQVGRFAPKKVLKTGKGRRPIWIKLEHNIWSILFNPIWMKLDDLGTILFNQVQHDPRAWRDVCIFAKYISGLKHVQLISAFEIQTTQTFMGFCCFSYNKNRHSCSWWNCTIVPIFCWWILITKDTRKNTE